MIFFLFYEHSLTKPWLAPWELHGGSDTLFTGGKVKKKKKLHSYHSSLNTSFVANYYFRVIVQTGKQKNEMLRLKRGGEVHTKI